MDINSKIYWDLKTFIKRLYLFYQKFSFDINARITKLSKELSISVELIGLVVYPIVWSIIIGFVFLCLDTFLFQGFKWFNFLAFKPLNTSSFDYFLSTATQVAGIFLTLYFTTLGLVISSSHLKSHKKIKDVFLDDVVSEAYITTILRFISISLLFLFFNSSNVEVLLNSELYSIEISYVSLNAYILFSLYTTYAFIALGRRLFSFYSLDILTGLVYDNLKKELKAVIKGGELWKVVDFQNHRRRKVENYFTFFDDMFNQMAITKKEYSTEEVVKGQVQLLQLIKEYSQIKQLIPSESHWYKRASKQKRFNKVGSHEKTLFLQAKVPLMPEEYIDHDWFENALKKIHTQYLNSASSNNTVSQMFFSTVEKLEIIASQLQMSSNEFLYDNLITYYFSEKRIQGDLVYDVGLAECLAILPINHLIGTCRYLEKGIFFHYLKKIQFKDSDSVYNHGGVSDLLKPIETLLNQIKIEKEIEGRFITPKWYFDQMIIVEFNKQLAKDLNSILKYAELLYVDKAKELAKHKQFSACFQLIFKGFEFLDKYAFQKERTIQPFLNQLSSSEILPEYPISFEYLSKIDELIEKLESELFELLSENLIHSVESERHEKLPDFFRMAFYLALQKSTEYISQGNFKNFETLYEPLFNVTSVKFEIERLEQLHLYNTEPNLQSLKNIYSTYRTFILYSSMVIVYGELYEKPMLEAIKSIWKKLPLNLNTFRELATIPDYPLFYMDPDSELHFNWQRELKNVFQSKGIIIDEPYPSWHKRKESTTTSKIIKILEKASGLEINDTLYDLFLVLVLEDEDNEFKFPPHHRRDEIRRALNV